ncbi:MAG: signal peptidase I [Nitriliruptoraceae bacterium]
MTEPSDGTSAERARPSFLRELPVLLLIALVVAFLLRTFVLQVFFIPSSSMEPTLQVDDRMVVEKVTYHFRDPQHGEVIVFGGASRPEGDEPLATRLQRGAWQFLGVVPISARDYVKRVIGVGGDVVELVDGDVSVNGHTLDEPYVVLGDRDNFGPVTVPDDHYFLLGDNRGNSSDSRRGLGFVARDDVIGRAAIIIWPMSNAGRLTTEALSIPEPAG